MSYISKETVKYATQKGTLNFTVTVKELYKYLTILLLSGYNKLPYRRMYWETRTVPNNYLAVSAMGRNKF